MTRKQKRLLDRVLRGGDLARILDDMAITSSTWKRWMQDEDFRQALALTVEEKEITEVIDALTLNRRAYNKLMRATNGGGTNGNGDSESEGGKNADTIDEKQARIFLSIIEAMAKRLGDLAPRLIPKVEKTEVKNPLLKEDDYAAIAEFLRRRREKNGAEPEKAGAV
jgi:hypothetical protein